MIILLLYAIVSFYYGRKNPLFYLILPYALQQGAGAFIDQSISIGGKNLLSVYDNAFRDALFFILSGLTLFFIRGRLPSISLGGSKIVLVYLTYYIILFFISLFTYPDTNEVLLAGRQLLYVPLSYFLWLAILRAATREQYNEFLTMFFYVTPISAVLYILNSSGTFSIFPAEFMYRSVEDDSGGFFRDFATIPIYLTPVLVLSILSLITPTVSVPKRIIYINLIILPIAVLFTFTRSRLVSIAIQVFIIGLLYTYYNRGNIFRKMLPVFLSLIFLSVPVYFLALKLYPGAVEYFTDRLTAAAVEKGEEQNVDIRARYLIAAMEVTSETSELIGAGFNRKHYRKMNSVGAWMVDSTIPLLLYHTGWLGVLIIYSVLFVFIIDSFLFFKKSDDWLVAYLNSYFISLFIFSLLMGGGALTTSLWTFLNFALYTTIRYNFWKSVQKQNI